MDDEDRRAYWDDLHANLSARDSPGQEPRVDPWVLDELARLPRVARVLELGCGRGHLAELLHAAGYDVHATDISPVALADLRHRAPGVHTTALDHAQPLPFAEATFDAVVADLSLHYFAADVTRRIFGEIARVLRADGHLLMRVNSAGDASYGAGVGREVEPGFYEHRDHYKRFFDEAMVRDFLAGWRDIRIRHGSTDRFGRTKHLLEAVARRPVVPPRNARASEGRP